MGFNPFMTPYTKYLIDTGQTERSFNALAEQKMNAGKALEDAIIMLYADISGNVVQFEPLDEDGRTKAYVKEDIVGRLDARTIVEGKEIPLEVKNTTRNLGTDASNMNKDYYAQCQGYCYVTESDAVMFAYLKDGWKLIYFLVPRDESFIEQMLNEVALFDIACDTKYFQIPEDIGKSKTMSDEVTTNPSVYTTARALAKVKQDIKKLEKEEEQVAETLKELLGEERGKLEGAEFKLNYYDVARQGTIDVKAFMQDFPEVDLEAYRNEGSGYSVLKVSSTEPMTDDEFEDLFSEGVI